jgi:hypothetical protein
MNRAVAIAVLVAAASLTLYRATLVPGFDFGDTGSFQATVGSRLLTPRDGYPLYFALGELFVRIARGDPAHALNLASAIEAALASGLVVLVGFELTGSALAGAAAALLLAGSYTFWSQAIIAEVYALHLAFVAATLLLLLRWQRKPTAGRLAAFFAVYAFGFGNHLSMILLAPAYTLFLFTAAPQGWRSIATRRVAAMALAFACLGACQYLWNLTTLWDLPHAPRTLFEGIARFWFDVTKSDWRETMVLNVPRSMLADHARMYLFDVRQQFGPVIPLVALAGLVWLVRVDWRRGVLILVVYLTNALFAYGYNVGDTHVFYLPSHLALALLVAPAIPRPVLSAAAIVYAVVRIYGDYPALDRSGDRRPSAVLASLTEGVDDRHSVLLADLNWQIQNGLSYFAKEVRPEVAWARSADVLLYAPVLIRDNAAIGREIVATERAWIQLNRAYGPLLDSAAEAGTRSATTTDLVQDLPAGTRYALIVLKPVREFALDTGDLNAALLHLTGGAIAAMPPGDYAVVGGEIGRTPVLATGSDSPFRRKMIVGGVSVEVRMDSWLSADTIRRMGFAHVIANRRHTLIAERGVSFAAFDETGEPVRTGYAAGIFGPQPRYLIKIARAMVDP